MTKTAWKDTATGKIYKVSKVEDAVAEIFKGMSLDEIRTLIDEQYSKAELVKFFTNRFSGYELTKSVLPKRLEQIEINISKKWIEDSTEKEFYSYTGLLDHIQKEYLDDDDRVMEYLDNAYEASEIFRAVERGEYDELITQAKSNIVQEIIDCYFTIEEKEV